MLKARRRQHTKNRHGHRLQGRVRAAMLNQQRVAPPLRVHRRSGRHLQGRERMILHRRNELYLQVQEVQIAHHLLDLAQVRSARHLPQRSVHPHQPERAGVVVAHPLRRRTAPLHLAERLLAPRVGGKATCNRL